MIKSELTFKVGKRTYFKYDVIDLIKEGTNLSKSEIRRLIKQGAVRAWIDTYDTKKSND